MSQITVLLSGRTVDHHPTVAPGGLALRGLHQLGEGETAVITGVSPAPDAATARRLFDLGFTPGTTVSKVRRAPFGGPSVYRVADYEIALRPAQARTIAIDTTAAA